MRQKALVLRILGGEDGRAARLDPFKDFGLRVGDRFDRAEMFEMSRGDRGDDRHMRTHELHQRTNFARMVHADFEHAERGFQRHPRERQGDAPMVVVRRRGGRDRTAARENEAEHLLGRGLSRTAGDSDDARL